MKDITPPAAPLKQPTRNERKMLRRKCPAGRPPKSHQVSMGWLNRKGQITEQGRIAIYGSGALQQKPVK